MSKTVAEQLAEREARLQAVLDTAVEGIVTIDADGIIETANQAAGRIFGYSSAEMVGSSVSMLMPVSDREHHDQYIRNYLDSGVPKIIGIGREVRGRRKNGEQFPMELAVSEVALADRTLFTGIFRDITDRYRAEEESRRRLKEMAHTARLLELGEMATGIAHEINQPLAAIVSFAEACLRMMQSDTGDDDTIRGALEQIAEQGQRAGSIIHGLRQLARKADVPPEWVDVNTLVREVVMLIGHELRRADVRLELQLDDAVPQVKVSKVQLEQVILNLARNAIESMVSVEMRDRVLGIEAAPEEGETVRVVVTDNGPGFCDDDLERVFETFFSTKSGGVGIGLAISRSILETHGGKLWAERTADCLTRFQCRIPVDGDVHV